MAKTKKKTSRAVYWKENISQWSESGLTQEGYYLWNKFGMENSNPSRGLAPYRKKMLFLEIFLEDLSRLNDRQTPVT